MKYIELGFGNRWFVRTEFEQSDGMEYEKKGIVGPVHFQSLYIRVWLGKTVIILDSKEGFKKKKKSRHAFKCIVGMMST
ncbi:DUF3977 family protein [Metasolibacillus meyeri]|uniref:DUF3977 family protein n=1 Tax=Metasolibacillus meyeri TaxID=1071052 RepID=A0AAW9NU57_9BACL|nr:DUF3977 family protein [Metasolibacillus meyeri]MEC1178060.1 DUF3977 family protein [Metasolibacillus meyeri]